MPHENGRTALLAGAPDPEITAISGTTSVIECANISSRSASRHHPCNGFRMRRKSICLPAAWRLSMCHSMKTLTGYPSLEAHHAGKAVITATDSGGTQELIMDGENGFVTGPSPRPLRMPWTAYIAIGSSRSAWVSRQGTNRAAGHQLGYCCE